MNWKTADRIARRAITVSTLHAMLQLLKQSRREELFFFPKSWRIHISKETILK